MKDMTVSVSVDKKYSINYNSFGVQLGISATLDEGEDKKEAMDALFSFLDSESERKVQHLIDNR